MREYKDFEVDATGYMPRFEKKGGKYVITTTKKVKATSNLTECVSAARKLYKESKRMTQDPTREEVVFNTLPENEEELLKSIKKDLEEDKNGKSNTKPSNGKKDV